MQTLDGPVENPTVEIEYRNGFEFNRNTRTIMIALGIFGLAALLSGGPGFIIGPAFIAIALYISTAKFGTQIAVSDGYLREYSSILGIKRGKWVSIDYMPYITILKLGRSVGANHVFSTAKVRMDASKCEVYLLSTNHRKRMLVTVCDSGKEAVQVAEKLSTKLEREIVQFNPKISQATKNRRYR